MQGGGGGSGEVLHREERADAEDSGVPGRGSAVPVEWAGPGQAPGSLGTAGSRSRGQR